jgi:NADPH-dependent curcumin reductase CurA
MTAWVGLKLAELQPTDRVFVSGAAGAVGSVAGQLAKLRGCFVVGSAGSTEKVRILTGALGFDTAFNYKDGRVREQLKAAAPDGIDVYFDNVGGDHLEAAISCMRNNGRIVACGAISGYNDEKPSPGPSNLFMVVTKRLTIRGFIISDWIQKEGAAFGTEVGPLVHLGRLKANETIVDGLEHAPQAFIDLLRGRNVGKMVVRI